MPLKTDRAIAVNVLIEVLDTGAYANIALRKALGESNLEGRSKGFVTDIVNETLRNLIKIDHTINSFSKIDVDKMKPLVAAVLRISVCQINHMPKVPNRAAVDEAVKLTKKYGLTNLTAFANGILRNIARKAEAEAVAETAGTTETEPLALKYSYPDWLMDKLSTWMPDPEQLENFCKNSHTPPKVIILPNLHKITTDGLLEKLATADLIATKLEDGPFITLQRAGDISALKTFKDGLFFVIDPGAYAATLALKVKPGQTVIDMCAAPGGKTFALACQMENTGEIKAYDIYPHRIELIKQTAKKLGLNIIKADIKDGTIFDPAFVATADAILVDAPCTGFGTIKKHPEIKYNRHPDDVKDMQKTQRAILSTAARYLKPGGRLVYSTCTITPDENGENIKDFLEKRPNFVLENEQQLMPTENNDAFYIATLVKEA